MIEYIWLVPLFPLTGFIINGLAGARLTQRQVGAIGASAVGLSFATVGSIFFTFIGLPDSQRYISRKIYTWIATGNLQVDISFLLDPLSLVMLLVVTGVGTLIHVYSIGYMHGDPGIGRYFSYLNLFTFSMILLVLADNFLLMFVGWEGVGLCSYLLIGFWFEKSDYAYAGRKAFVVNRVGDFGFMLGMFLIFVNFGSFNFDRVFSQVPGEVSAGVFTAICLLLFVGATGKSAQIPLFVWLPDAMAGPTPVSALIHAATMVTAGVYMLARCHFLFLQSELSMMVVAIIGISTAFLAATIALVSTDIKKVLAYSTISQLGYMFLACGVGAFGAGIFHVSTHAYFKALLFLSAGSVMHALGNETDMRKMGGLKDKLPVTYKVFLIGALALAGIPVLAGFWSKDEILWQAFSSHQGSFLLWLAGVVVAGLTALYTFRLIFSTFFGKSRVPKEVEAHIHESPRVMTVPLGILAFLSVVGGWIGLPHFLSTNQFEHFLDPVFARYIQTTEAAGHGSVGLEVGLMGVSVLVALLGIGLAYRFYVARPEKPAELAEKVKGLYTFLWNKWFVDELYDATIVRPIYRLSDSLLWRFIDVRIIDGLVNGVARWLGALANLLRKSETGMVQNYALSIALGVILVVGYFILK
jgi:NADH-quinone oxidoreductase subunit L